VSALDILFLIVARGGSKGLPGKNLKTVQGLSLVGYKARAARASTLCARLMISTDSPAIAEEAKRHGAEAPFMRPAELASDTATSASVVAHALDWIESNEKRKYDAVMLLEPSSPFATPAHFDAAAALYTARNADLVVGMRHTEPSTVFIAEQPDNGSIASIVQKIQGAAALRRQDQKPEWTINGALYLFGWDAFKATGQIYGAPEKSFGLLMDKWHSIEIESAEDLAMAEFAAANGHVDMSVWKA